MSLRSVHFFSHKCGNLSHREKGSAFFPMSLRSVHFSHKCRPPLLEKLGRIWPCRTITDRRARLLAWWKARDHVKKADPTTGRPEGLPHRAKMARQFLGRPATSAGVERMFSKAGKLHDDMKKGQQDDTLEHSLFAAANAE